MRKISPPTGIRSPDRPARSESLYRLSYPGPQAATISYGKEKILEYERGRTRLHALENSLWTRLRAWFKTDYVMMMMMMMMMVTGVQTPGRPSLGLIAILTTLSLSILFYDRLLNIFFGWPLFYSIQLECLLASQDDIGSVESSSSSHRQHRHHQHNHHCYHHLLQLVRLLPSGSWICSDDIFIDLTELIASG